MITDQTVLKSGKKYFYGGEIQPYGDITIGALDKILDLIEEYIELVEAGTTVT